MKPELFGVMGKPDKAFRIPKGRARTGGPGPFGKLTDSKFFGTERKLTGRRHIPPVPPQGVVPLRDTKAERGDERQAQWSLLRVESGQMEADLRRSAKESRHGDPERGRGYYREDQSGRTQLVRASQTGRPPKAERWRREKVATQRGMKRFYCKVKPWKFQNGRRCEKHIDCPARKKVFCEVRGQTRNPGPTPWSHPRADPGG